MSDYERIATIIRYLDDHHDQQPALSELAALVGLSRYHFQRLFTRWAGVSPKTFLQCVTFQNARQRLLDGQSVLDAALETGLSGPSRLHDLCVTLEAASPGEIKAGGRGWTIEAGFAQSPFGWCLLAQSPRGICQLSFVDQPDQPRAANQIGARWPQARIRWCDDVADQVVRSAFPTCDEADDNHGPGHLSCYVSGTPFQVRVWRALLEIPTAGLTTYGKIARSIGSPQASRAVGKAVGSNPIGVLIPCHRVIRETGVIGAYRWGNVRKRALIAREELIRAGD
ncbi:MAG: methylated-DNA--[protein]-cysteine S-methyltransferase [Pirellulales bacterium]|nr:methylated-DNA--[protein]-cysteine S-methyltransferase [Pirellulales bacterium]